ncbi:hypothetical protein Zmor_015040 [Zophobas morio]|uniref:Putative nuclease HARBI1 n=1 Tax=Zophobas morio TaxID=2755281 RepID=A0AA38IDJ5_9CUCU|nr:hypothetical protein Zmor_015040 [Zophobas morio]
MAHLWGQLLVLEQMEREEQENGIRVFRRMVRDTQNPFAISDAEFTRHFRFHKNAALEIIRDIEPHMVNNSYVSKIPKVLRILSALNFFATGSYQRSVGANLLSCCSQPVVSRNIQEVSTIIVRYLLKDWVHFPRNDRERNELKHRFMQRHRMPNIIGIVDGTHIAIKKPNENEHIYVNRKNYHSLNCQIICDSELRILSIVARWPGSTHDAFIWRSSRVGQAMRANYENGDTESRIMGDSGYPCLPWLLIPVPHPATPQEERYNNRFKSCRSTVERCIGVLKGRFRCLLKDRVLHYTPQKAAKIIMACTILHNMAVFYRVDDPAPMWDDIDREDLPVPRYIADLDIPYRRLGQQQRREYIVTNF